MVIPVVFSDASPTASPHQGVIRIALPASDISRVDHVVPEAAMSPKITSRLIDALTDAIAAHNGAADCDQPASPATA
jgi:hypothetical protein